MNNEVDKFLERILGISKPWYVETIDENESNKELHIHLNYPKGTKFKCPKCGNECSTYDSNYRTWRDLDIHSFKTFIRAKLPRINCCDKTTTIKPPWARENSHFTLLMEENILELAKMSTVSKVAKYLKEHDTRIWRVIHYWVNKCRVQADFSKVENLGIDETSKKGHKYITSFVNLDTRRVMYVVDGKDSTTVDSFANDFKEHKGVPENIKNVTCDMSLAFEKGIKKTFPMQQSLLINFMLLKI